MTPAPDSSTADETQATEHSERAGETHEREPDSQEPSLPLGSSDLTQFQCRILSVLTGEPRYGLAIKRELETAYGAAINHSRLYQNLERLVDSGSITKRALDGRTNEYALTETGHTQLASEIAYLARGFEGGDQ
ncbi:helix-turn-helix transcriptional regulator [Halosegnis longus]|uniref:helix-turn-helix transcriptional regulator n=1 Tax=Halosegnis longus TaxID=2216012 RepID=UPI0009ADFD30|nr:PadR family transcriptional regulator [Salella cibi]